MSVAVVVEHKIKEGQLGAYVDYMKEMIALTKQEDGCIAYDLYEGIDEPGKCIMVELWESKEKLDVHMQTEHFQKFVPGGAAFQDAPSVINIYQKL